ncbi:hypothetical protein [Epilithonimonas sp.]|uniref:hypothetical protein n=1 Tax=Epilithonimonas sp. TaxID=2894511 RepID=UPI0028A148E4|nr:hypothetical protein [Epilithonimonas sp.]
MENFSLLVRKKYDVLNSDEKVMFNEEYERRKKPFGDDNNNDLALEILRDIAMVFGNSTAVQEIKENAEVEKATTSKGYVNNPYLTSISKSKETYLFNYFYVVIIAIIGLTAYMKPTKAKIENDIINKFLETQPQFLTIFKNIFVGEEIPEEKAEAFIFNAFRRIGYDSVSFEDSNFGIVRRLQIKDDFSQKQLLVAYGLFGKSIISFTAGNLNMNSFMEKSDLKKNGRKNAPKENENYGDIESLDYDPDYWKKHNESTFDENRSINVKRKSEILTLPQSSVNSYESKLKSKYDEDSIKI